MTTLEAIFNGLPNKYRELRFFTTNKLNTTDVAALLVVLDEQVFQALMVFAVNNTHRVFLPNASGIWEEQHGKHELIKTVNDVRTRIDRLIMIPIRTAIYGLTPTQGDEILEAKKKQLMEAENIYKTLLFKLGNDTFKNQVIKEVINTAIIRTKENGVSLSSFDSFNGCIGFLDGVYDFNTKQFYRGESAHRFYVTRTVDYEYDNVLNVSADTMTEFQRFIDVIHPKKPIQDFVMKKLSNSLQGIQEQCILIHYNIGGKNGKTSIFKLVKKTFGNYFVKCNVGLLYPPSFNNPNSSNEELMSLKNILCALFSEPSTKQKLHAPFIKELTGGDEQSSRRNYGSKETFVFNGLAHLLCNKIPELDEFDGGTARRMLCIPYYSTFVDKVEEVDEENYKFLRDMGVDKKFDEWRYCFMRLLIEFDDREVQTPEAVQEHTKSYLDRENTIKTFLDETVQKTENVDNKITLTDLYERYTMYCKSLGMTPIKRSMFKDDIRNNLDERCYKDRTTSSRDVWSNYTFAEYVIPESPPKVSESPKGCLIKDLE